MPISKNSQVWEIFEFFGEKQNAPRSALIEHRFTSNLGVYENFLNFDMTKIIKLPKRMNCQNFWFQAFKISKV